MQSDVRYEVVDKTSWRIYECQHMPLVKKKHERCCLQALSCRPFPPPEATAPHLSRLQRIFWQRPWIKGEPLLSLHYEQPRQLILELKQLSCPCWDFSLFIQQNLFRQWSGRRSASLHALVLYVNFYWNLSIFDMAPSVKTPPAVVNVIQTWNPLDSLYISWCRDMFQGLLSCHSLQ